MASANDRTYSAGQNKTGYADPTQALRRATGDARLAAVFKQIRAIVGVTEMEMARRLGTDLGTVLDFESGIVDALPPWPVTARLVERYAQLGMVDPAPILSRLIHLQTPVLPPSAVAETPPPILVQSLVSDSRGPSAATPPIARRQLATAGTPPPQRAASYAPGLIQPEASAEAAEAAHLGFPSRSRLRTTGNSAERTSAPSDEDKAAIASASRLRRRRRVVRSALAASPFLFAIGLFVLLQLTPRPVYAVARALPGAFGSMARGLIDVMAVQTASFKDGLRWIDVHDPRLRKGDRLSSR